MRVNIYHQELTDQVEALQKVVDGVTYYGIRFYLESIPEMRPPLHRDDDSSAVTFWATDKRTLINMLYDAGNMLWEAEKLEAGDISNPA